jgi:hypothetical protein
LSSSPLEAFVVVRPSQYELSHQPLGERPGGRLLCDWCATAGRIPVAAGINPALRPTAEPRGHAAPSSRASGCASETRPDLAMHWLHDIPDRLLAVLVVTVSVGLGLAGLIATRPLRSHAVSNDVSGAVLGTVGLVQGVLLALAAVATWSNYTEAGDAAGREAAAVANLSRQFEGYPEPARQRLKVRLRPYLERLITDEWPTLRQGEGRKAHSPSKRGRRSHGSGSPSSRLILVLDHPV